MAYNLNQMRVSCKMWPTTACTLIQSVCLRLIMPACTTVYECTYKYSSGKESMRILMSMVGNCKGDSLVPRKKEKAPAPDIILKKVHCSGKTGCKTRCCTCRKLGLVCTVICKMCNQSCANWKMPGHFDD